MKKTKILISVLLFALFLSSIVFSNGLNLNGLGAKAIAMGGAFVGISDDLSAIFWNPAGLAQLNKKTFGFCGELIIPSGNYKFLTDFEAITVSKNYPAGMVAYYHPISKNLVAGIGIYIPSSLGNKWDGTDLKLISQNTSYNWESYIGVATVSPTLAFKISDQIFVGATLNINYGLFDISSHAGTMPVPSTPGVYIPFDLGQQKVKLTGWGYSTTFGILLKPIKQFSIGATFRTPTKMKFNGDTSISNFSLLGYPESSGLDAKVIWPMWIAGGVAFKPVKNFTLTADVHFTNWKKIDVIKFNFKDATWKAILATSGGDEILMHWKDAFQIRFGVEYMINSLAFRGGYYLDPAPAPDETMNVLFPNYDFNVISFGIGCSLKVLQIDLVVEYLMAKDRNVSIQYEEAMPGKYSMKIWSPAISMSFSW
jgi:long-chain fatty acid transport protein